MVMFAPGISITDGRSTSCHVFCAYHDTFLYNNTQNVMYAIIPDQGGNCAGGCGSGDKWDATGISMSHELAESVTDPAVGLAFNTGPPMAWYDNANGEIGDVCETSATINGYTVQTLWSNRDNQCISVPLPPNDFTITAASGKTASLALGSTTTLTYNTALLRGTPQPLVLTLTGMGGNGITADLEPPTMNSGDMATVTITATPDADQVRLAVQLSAAQDANTVHAATVTLSVGTPGDFSVAITPQTQTVLPGASASYTVATALVAAPMGEITLSAGGLPAGVTATFDPPTINPGDSSTMTITASAEAESGSTRVSAVGTALGTVRANGTTIVVDGPDAGTPDARIAPPDAQPDAAPAIDAPPSNTPDASPMKTSTANGASSGGCAIGGGGPGSFPALLLAMSFIGLLLARRRR